MGNIYIGYVGAGSAVVTPAQLAIDPLVRGKASATLVLVRQRAAAPTFFLAGTGQAIGPPMAFDA